MSAYSEYFLSSKSSVVMLETFELSHPNFTQPYRVVRNAVDGLTATGESGPLTFQYYPARVDQGGSRDDLDQSITITFGDLGEIVPHELDNVRAAANFSTRPTLIYRAWRSDDLSALLYGPITLAVESFSLDRAAATIVATAARLNANRTGELYTINRFPMLRGFL